MWISRSRLKALEKKGKYHHDYSNVDGRRLFNFIIKRRLFSHKLQNTGEGLCNFAEVIEGIMFKRFNIFLQYSIFFCLLYGIFVQSNQQPFNQL